MRKFIQSALIGSSLLLLGTVCNAQVDRDMNRDINNVNNGSIVDQVRGDLNQVKDTGSLRFRQRRLLNRADRDLSKFEMSENQGYFNRHELDRAISRIQNISSSSRITGDQQAMLQRDADRLSDLGGNMPTYSYQTNGHYDRYGNWHPND